METDRNGANRRSSDLALAFYAIVSGTLQLPRLPKAVVSGSLYVDREPNVDKPSNEADLGA